MKRCWILVLAAALTGCAGKTVCLDEAVMRACAEQSHLLRGTLPKHELWAQYLQCVDTGLMRLGYPPISTAIGP